MHGNYNYCCQQYYHCNFLVTFVSPTFFHFPRRSGYLSSMCVVYGVFHVPYATNLTVASFFPFRSLLRTPWILSDKQSFPPFRSLRSKETCLASSSEARFKISSFCVVGKTNEHGTCPTLWKNQPDTSYYYSLLTYSTMQCCVLLYAQSSAVWSAHPLCVVVYTVHCSTMLCTVIYSIKRRSPQYSLLTKRFDLLFVFLD